MTSYNIRWCHITSLFSLFTPSNISINYQSLNYAITKLITTANEMSQHVKLPVNTETAKEQLPFSLSSVTTVVIKAIVDKSHRYYNPRDR